MYRVREKERRKLQQSAEWNSTNFLCYQSVTSWAILWWMMILLYYDSTWICRTSDGVNCYKGIKSNHVFQIRQFCSFTHLNLLGDCKSHCLCKSCLSSFIKTFSQHSTWGRETSKNVQLGGFINWETMRHVWIPLTISIWRFHSQFFLIINFSLFLSLVCLIIYWYCNEEFCLGNPWELRVNDKI